MVGFDDPWFADMYNRFAGEDRPGESGGAANTILGGLIILAQSIDWLATSVREAGTEVSEAVERLAPEKE